MTRIDFLIKSKIQKFLLELTGTAKFGRHQHKPCWCIGCILALGSNTTFPCLCLQGVTRSIRVQGQLHSLFFCCFFALLSSLTSILTFLARELDIGRETWLRLGWHLTTVLSFFYFSPVFQKFRDISGKG